VNVSTMLHMTTSERANLVLAFARILHVNGQATEQTVSAAECLANAFGLHATITPRWGELQLVAYEKNRSFIARVSARATDVEMARVAAATDAIDDIVSARRASDVAMVVIADISNLRSAPTWLFTLAVASGAVALGVISGVQHVTAAILIFVSAAVGAIARRALSRLFENPFVQPFCAAGIAGIIGALVVRYDLSSSLRLVAVCPCMMLVPGPHFLNGAFDLIRGRLALGAARLTYAGLIVVVISLGLLLGLALLGVSVPADPAGRAIPLWQDVIAAGVATTAYGVIFSLPLRMLPWAIGAGMFAHAMRWVVLNPFGFSVATGALAACVVAAIILAPVSRLTRMPFAAIGFAAVVSMIPGVYLFRMGSGLLQLASTPGTTPDLLSTTTADGLTAALIILAMSLGLIVAKMIVDYLSDRWAEHDLSRPRSVRSLKRAVENSSALPP
jgi:uncharacterized membrane protein YjjP (DUF1212 family)